MGGRDILDGSVDLHFSRERGLGPDKTGIVLCSGYLGVAVYSGGDIRVIVFRIASR